MENVKQISRPDAHAWSITLADLLPLWLLALAIMTEGFPQPPIPVELAITSFVFAIAVSIVLLWKKWMTIELFLYNLFPLLLLGTFDEISTRYKTPFIIACALLLTAGVVAYQHYRSAQWRWLILLFTASVTWAMASHATDGYWYMVSNLGYGDCFPDGYGCGALTGRETPWWVMFFS